MIRGSGCDCGCGCDDGVGDGASKPPTLGPGLMRYPSLALWFARSSSDSPLPPERPPNCSVVAAAAGCFASRYSHNSLAEGQPAIEPASRPDVSVFLFPRAAAAEISGPQRVVSRGREGCSQQREQSAKQKPGDAGRRGCAHLGAAGPAAETRVRADRLLFGALAGGKRENLGVCRLQQPSECNPLEQSYCNYNNNNDI